MITADTITDEQIDRVWQFARDVGVHGDPEVMHTATVARNAYGDFTKQEQRIAKTWCANYLNARTQEGK